MKPESHFFERMRNLVETLRARVVYWVCLILRDAPYVTAARTVARMQPASR